MFEMGTGVTSLLYLPEVLREKVAPSKLHKRKEEKRKRKDLGVRITDKEISKITCGQVLDLLVPVG